MTTESRRTPDENVIGTVIGHYKVTEVLNQGGMGAVYRAEHPLIGKPAVIKLLLPDLSSHEEMVHRFFNEAKAASAIRHPGIVEIFDFGYHSDGRAYIVMEFLDGESLGERLHARDRLPELECAVLARSIAGALGAAHAKGIVHRDLKPDNIFLVPDPDMPTGERTKVLDFGIAKLNGDLPTEVSRTRTGALMGTPLYMAPEQARGAGEVDARADVYSLGCMLYEMLTGAPPFVAEGSGEIIAMQLFAEPVPPREILPELSSEIERVVLGMLEKDPAKRPQKAKDVVDALGALLPRLSSRLSAVVPVRPQTKMRQVVTPRPQVSAAMKSMAERAPERPEPKPTTLGGSAAHVIPSIPPDDFAPKKSRTAGIVIAAAFTVAVGVGAFAIVKTMRKGAGDSTTTTTTTAPTTTTTSQIKAPAPTPAPVAPPKAETVTLTFDLDPATITLTLDGAPATLANGAITIPKDDRDHALVATADGYVARTRSIKADRDQSLAIALAAAAAPVIAPPPVAPPAHPPHVKGGPAHTTSKPPKHDPTKPNPTTSPNGSPIETNL